MALQPRCQHLLATTGIATMHVLTLSSLVLFTNGSALLHALLAASHLRSHHLSMLSILHLLCCQRSRIALPAQLCAIILQHENHPVIIQGINQLFALQIGNGAHNERTERAAGQRHSHRGAERRQLRQSRSLQAARKQHNDRHKAAENTWHAMKVVHACTCAAVFVQLPAYAHVATGQRLYMAA